MLTWLRQLLCFHQFHNERVVEVAGGEDILCANCGKVLSHVRYT